jgi:hypothetical protein
MTAVEAVAKAWSLMASVQPASIYIYDNETYETFPSGEFAGLFRGAGAGKGPGSCGI